MFKNILAKIIAVIKGFLTAAPLKTTEVYSGVKGTEEITKETKFSWIKFLSGIYRVGQHKHTNFVKKELKGMIATSYCFLAFSIAFSIYVVYIGCAYFLTISLPIQAVFMAWVLSKTKEVSLHC